MAFNVTASLDALESFAQQSGDFAEVHRGEPKSPASAGERLSAAFFMSSARVATTTLNRTVELHEVICRIYVNMLDEPEGDIETKLALVAGQFADQLEGDLELGGAVRGVDIGGIYGDPLRIDFGHVELGGTLYRIADVRIPLIVNGETALVR